MEMTPLEAEWIQKIREYKQPVCRACGKPMTLSILQQPSVLDLYKTVWGACYMCKTKGCGVTITRIREDRCISSPPATTPATTSAA